MQFFETVRQFFARLFDRRAPRRDVVPLVVPPAVALPLTVHREVSANGVRIFSLCGSCGARLGASATLCEECAQGRSPSTPPF